MSNIKSFCKIILFCAVSVLFAGCPNDPDDNTNPDIGKGKYFDQLVGTTWVHKTSVIYDEDGKVTSSYDYSTYSTYMTAYSFYYMFRSELKDDMSQFGYNFYELYVDHPKEKKTTVSLWSYWPTKDSISFQSYHGYITKLTNNELVLKMFYSDSKGYAIDTFEKAGERIHYVADGGDSSSGGGGSSSGYKPEVTNFDFTATRNSIKVTFTIDSKPTSASIYYGESSATKSAGDVSIIGNSVTARASGLKSGTKYYFKITVKNNYGSTTSDGWPATTLY